MKRHQGSSWLRTLSALALSACLMSLSSFALAQERDLVEPSEDAASAPAQPADEDEEDGEEATAEEGSQGETVFGQHTSTLYRGRLARR